jgi:hypothetical protein
MDIFSLASLCSGVFIGDKSPFYSFRSPPTESKLCLVAFWLGRTCRRRGFFSCRAGICEKLFNLMSSHTFCTGKILSNQPCTATVAAAAVAGLLSRVRTLRYPYSPLLYKSVVVARTCCMIHLIGSVRFTARRMWG